MCSTRALLCLPHWVMYCTYVDENNAMDTLPDFITPGFRMVFPNTNFFNTRKTLPADTEGVMFVACCCH